MSATPNALTSCLGGCLSCTGEMSRRRQAGTHSVLLSQKNWLPAAQLPELGTGNIRACAGLGAKPKERKHQQAVCYLLFQFLALGGGLKPLPC